jgi:hypothetical protein
MRLEKVLIDYKNEDDGHDLSLIDKVRRLNRRGHKRVRRARGTNCILQFRGINT